MNMLSGVIFGNNKAGHLLADGQQRALAANKERVRMEVLAQFAGELKSAGWFRRLVIKRFIRKEITQRLKRVAPTAANY